MWLPRPDRPDPVAVIEDQNGDRLASLVPVRNAWLAQSPLAFFCGSAKIMSGDLAATLTSGLAAQICGDAHLGNFGVFSAPGGSPVFDIASYDQTIAGPWEWDVKRLATSVVVAARHLGLDTRERRSVAEKPVATYRRAMASFARMGYEEVWYAQLPSDDLRAVVATSGDGKRRKRGKRTLSPIRAGHGVPVGQELLDTSNGNARLIARPPDLVSLRDTPAQDDGAELTDEINAVFSRYQASLDPSCRRLLERYEPIEAARKLGSIGTMGLTRYVILLIGRDTADPLFLELSQAVASVLEDELPAGEYANHGERIAAGRRLMQAGDDPFLGWSVGRSGAHYAAARLRMQAGAWNEADPSVKRLSRYAKLCGWALARAHARSGDAVAIAGYLGGSKVFDRAVADFAERYADQNERDYQAFAAAIAAGSVPTVR